MPVLAIPPDLAAAYAGLSSDLHAVFGPRLYALVAFGPRLRSPAGKSARRSSAPRGDSLALVDRVSAADLTACAPHAERWHSGHLRMPLLLGRDEFARSLDAFPLEYDDIIAHHVALVGDDPFAGIAVAVEDLRRACEARAKGHLLHLREGYLEARARPVEVASLILASASPFSALLGSLARLKARSSGASPDLRTLVFEIGASPDVVRQVLALEADPVLGADEAARLYPDYVAAVERLVVYIDLWTRGSR